jgi:hypothetical protein
MNSAAPIPAENFLDEVIAALIASDVELLRQLEAAASTVAAPRNRTQYLKKLALFAELLGETARNLRFLRRVTAKPSSGPYAINPR